MGLHVSDGWTWSDEEWRSLLSEDGNQESEEVELRGNGVPVVVEGTLLDTHLHGPSRPSRAE